MRKLQLAGCVLGLGAALSDAAAAPPKSWQQQVLASAAPYIDRANIEWIRAVRVGDANVMSAPYASNGIMIGPDGAVFHGRAAVRAMYAKKPAGMRVLKASIRSDGRAVHDHSHVYEWGTASITIQQGGKLRESSGTYLTVWRRERTRWVITHNIAF